MKDSVCGIGKCTGCMACTAKCTKAAITIEDALDSYTAKIDGSKCIRCGGCERVCQMNRPVEFRDALFGNRDGLPWRASGRTAPLGEQQRH